MRLLRLLRILTVVWRYRLDEIVVASLKKICRASSVMPRHGASSGCSN